MRGIERLGARWLGVAAAGIAAIVVIALAGWQQLSPPAHPPTGSNAATVGPAVGPILYYEVLDADGSNLMERRLDGRSQPRVVATRTDAGDGRTWTVDPTGNVAVAVVAGRDDEELGAVSVSSGQTLWTIRTSLAAPDSAVWSADGRQLALTDGGTGEANDRAVIIVDAATGASRRVTIPNDALAQGFDPDGGLILRRRVSPDGPKTSWQFLRVDPASGTIERLVNLPDVGPLSDYSDDVDPAAGLAVDLTIGENDQGTAVRLWNLGTNTSRILATLPSVERVSIDPAGFGVAFGAGQAIRYIAFGGGESELFNSDDSVNEFTWSVTGDYLVVSADHRGPVITVIERATGRSVVLPKPAAVAGLLIVRMIGGVALPEQPLPAEPEPSPTPAPSGADIGAAPGLFSSWVDRTDASQTIHVARLVPTEGGGMRIAAEMPTLDAGPAVVPDDGGPDVRILPRPGTSETLIWVSTQDSSQGWLWDGGDQVEPLRLPADWPSSAFDVAWRPDGRAIAASAGRSTVDGDFEGIFAIAAPGGSSTTVVPIVGEYDRLEGWWSDAELRVGHGICTEGCTGRYSWSARLRIKDHRLVQMTAADRAKGEIDVVAPNRDTLVVTFRNEDPADDIVVTWPTELGPTEDLDFVGFAADHSTFLVAHESATGTDLIEVPDAIGRAVDGRLADPEPQSILHLARRHLQFDVAPGGGWVVVTDRVGDAQLVRIADGRAWQLDRDRAFTWADR